MERRTLRLDGERLLYLVGGRGPLLVLSYALGSLVWGCLDRLSERCTLAVPEWLDSRTTFETRITYRWLAPLTASLGFSSASLCTWSLGAPAAIRYAAGQPGELSHLVLVDPAGLRAGLPPLTLSEVPHFLLSQILGRPTKGYVRNCWRRWVRQPGVDTGRLEEAHYRFLSRPGVFRSNRRMEASALRRSPLDELASISAPTLLLAGRHSSVLGPDAARAGVAALRHGRLVLFEESAHALQIEEPERFHDVVADFVGR